MVKQAYQRFLLTPENYLPQAFRRREKYTSLVFITDQHMLKPDSSLGYNNSSHEYTTFLTLSLPACGMATGVETAGLILAAFPLVISALEHYENGFQVIREWVRFRGEFAAFLNALIRQRIFFRQNIEELLGPIVATEYDISILLDRPGGKAWADETLNAKLRQRLPGKYEYESYATTVSYIMETLHKLMDKLKIVERRVCTSPPAGLGSTTDSHIASLDRACF